MFNIDCFGILSIETAELSGLNFWSIEGRKWRGGSSFNGQPGPTQTTSPFKHSTFQQSKYPYFQAKIRTVPKSQDPEDWPAPRCKTPFYPSSPWFRELLTHNELYRIDLKFKFTSQVWLDNGFPSVIWYHWLLSSHLKRPSFSLIFKYAKHSQVEPHSLA